MSLKIDNLRIPEGVYLKLKADQKAYNYKQIETMIVHALENYYDC